jgi:hypothetical protein
MKKVLDFIIGVTMFIESNNMTFYKNEKDSKKNKVEIA